MPSTTSGRVGALILLCAIVSFGIHVSDASYMLYDYKMTPVLNKNPAKLHQELQYGPSRCACGRCHLFSGGYITCRDIDDLFGISRFLRTLNHRQKSH